MNEALKNNIDFIKRQRGQGSDAIRLYCADTSLPLDERWDILEYAFNEIKIGITDYRCDFDLDRPDGDDWLWNTPLYMEKYEERDVFWIYETIIEANADGDFSWTNEDDITFKEFCLRDFVTSMKLD